MQKLEQHGVDFIYRSAEAAAMKVASGGQVEARGFCREKLTCSFSLPRVVSGFACS